MLSVEQLRGLHSKMDLNGDSKVSLAEIIEFSKKVSKEIHGKHSGEILEDLDKSKDGKLSLQELLDDMKSNDMVGTAIREVDEAERVRIETAKFQAADANGDGHLDTSELISMFVPETHDGVMDLAAAETLREKDLNGDGKLGPVEFWRDIGRGKDAVVDDQDVSLTEDEKRDFAKLDSDGDGKLDLEELKKWESGLYQMEAATMALFEIADNDGDDHISADELASAREALAGKESASESWLPISHHLAEWAEHHEL